MNWDRRIVRWLLCWLLCSGQGWKLLSSNPGRAVFQLWERDFSQLWASTVQEQASGLARPLWWPCTCDVLVQQTKKLNKKVKYEIADIFQLKLTSATWLAGHPLRCQSKSASPSTVACRSYTLWMTSACVPVNEVLFKPLFQKVTKIRYHFVFRIHSQHPSYTHVATAGHDIDHHIWVMRTSFFWQMLQRFNSRWPVQQLDRS